MASKRTTLPSLGAVSASNRAPVSNPHLEPHLRIPKSVCPED